MAWAGSLELRDRQVDCIVTKISAAGATVRVYEPVVCLIAIVLHCPRLEPCRARIIWRRDNLLGLRFLEKPQKVAWALGQVAFGPALIEHQPRLPALTRKGANKSDRMDHHDEPVNGPVPHPASTCPTLLNTSPPPLVDENSYPSGCERSINELWLGDAGQHFAAALAEIRRRAEEALQAVERRRIDETAALSDALRRQERVHAEVLSQARDAEAGRLAEAERRWRLDEAGRFEAARQQWEQEKRAIRADAEREREACEQRMAAAAARWRQEEAQRFAACAHRWQAKAEQLETELAALKSEAEAREQRFHDSMAEMRAEAERSLHHAQAEWQKETTLRLAEAESAIRAVFEQALALPTKDRQAPSKTS